VPCQAENIRVLTITNGNVQFAIERLLSGRGVL
jgi:hypothetical protein